jgi:hypothetical protein
VSLWRKWSCLWRRLEPLHSQSAIHDKNDPESTKNLRGPAPPQPDPQPPGVPHLSIVDGLLAKARALLSVLFHQVQPLDPPAFLYRYQLLLAGLDERSVMPLGGLHARVPEQNGNVKWERPQSFDGPTSS